MEPKPKTFSPERLREARMASGLSLEAICGELGISGTTLRNWEGGKHEPDASDLATIAALTGKPLDFFFLPSGQAA